MRNAHNQKYIHAINECTGVQDSHCYMYMQCSMCDSCMHVRVYNIAWFTVTVYRIITGIYPATEQGKFRYCSTA